MMKNKVLKYIKQNKMIEAGESVVVGVSGGADSMCLLHILNSIKDEYEIDIIAVHIHHGIRKETADRDAVFVKEYCESIGIPCHICRYDVPFIAKECGMSEEEAGRKVRYDSFYNVLDTVKNNGKSGKIAVAHNADDLAETVLLNLFRGSGLTGLTGIRPVRGDVIRPILCLSRAEVEEYDRHYEVRYITDETNFETEYTRNKIRLDIMPRIVSGINDKAVSHVNNTAAGLTLIDDYMDKESDKVIEAITHCDGNDLYINIEKFNKLHVAMQWQVSKKCLCMVAKKSKDISRIHIEGLMTLFGMQTGKKVNLPYGMTAIREYGEVHLRQDISNKESVCKSVEKDNSVNICGFGEYTYIADNFTAKLSVESDTFSKQVFEENNFTKWIDCDIMKANLQLRTRKPGDYIVIDEAGSKKKLKDFFIDKKIPQERRDKVLLVASGNEIVWIVGYRLSGAYKVSKDTKNILKLSIRLEEL